MRLTESRTHEFEDARTLGGKMKRWEGKEAGLGVKSRVSVQGKDEN